MVGDHGAELGMEAKLKHSTWKMFMRCMLFLVATGLVLTFAPGCARNQASQADTSQPVRSAQLEVVNRSSSDMDIFVVRTGQRFLLGLAPNNETTRFVLQPVQVTGGLVRFEARPLGGLARPITSDPTTVSPGDTISLSIPPP